jgi:methylamine dehydrogenase light chain
MSRFDLDALGTLLSRRLAQATSRRGILSRLGLAIVAAPVFPLLPNERRAQAAELTDFQKNAQTKNDQDCNYWRYCAIDGSLCSCCGGGVHTCPPGTSASLTSWVGTCYNPDDKRSYLIAYHDCCGASACSQCHCNNVERATPAYRPQGNGDIVWCFGGSSMAYHCSTAVLVGVAS